MANPTQAPRPQNQSAPCVQCATLSRTVRRLTLALGIALSVSGAVMFCVAQGGINRYHKTSGALARMFSGGDDRNYGGLRVIRVLAGIETLAGVIVIAAAGRRRAIRTQGPDQA